ncbi:phosphoenolpyruvate synthase [Actinoplanes capillaceus]|uniref:Phosphoenolpyruvate synthase n=1 Tax=Actinoplanes campanulatus TaxID=113559 RepID=A0ABQ3WZ28_9ACTN|nr:PEP/pyruvate-binding domain-containing protein [Actinoplanes capillaceus]GID51537.1 phosphoenolpyruvate synthase [Actinoplanes capillaceus]
MPAESRFVLDFADIDAGMLPEVGGKAANLGKLARAGLPVPPGVCVTTDAYRQAADAAPGLAGIIEELTATAPGDLPRLTELAGRAREALLAAPLPAEVAAAVAAGYRGMDAVAVRSSATAEDLPFASFAGQQDTYLNVVGETAVLDAVHRCWASLWTDRAVTYRAANGIDHRAVRLAVVIQRMVQSAVAGVLFTANPVTGRRREAVIDASPGLGESVVSGTVNPDHFVVDTATGRIRDRRLGDKQTLIRGVRGGGVEHVTTPGDTGRACLTDAQVRAVAVLGARVEASYDGPQDIEWAIDPDGALWLTQARPITTLYPLPAARDGLRAYLCVTLAQGLIRPITPLGLATFRLFSSSVAELFGRPVADPVAGAAAAAQAGLRLFVDLTGVLRSPAGRMIVPRLFDVMEARAAVVMRSLFDRPEFALTHRSVLPFAAQLAEVAVRHRLPLHAVRALRNPQRVRRDLDALADRARRCLDLPAGTTATARLDQTEQVLVHEGIGAVMPIAAPAALAGFGLLALAGRLLPDLAPGELQTVLRGLPNNVTTEMDLALWQLSSRIRAAGETLGSDPGTLAGHYHAGTLPPAAQQGLADFLDRYGHRAVAEIDVGLPRWSEDPRHVLGVLLNYQRLDDPAAAPDAVFAAAAREAEEMTATLTGRARGGLRRRAVRFALHRARALAGLREFPKYYFVVVLAAARRQFAAVGAELAAAGRIGTADDVFFLDLPEIRAALAGRDQHAVVAARRAEYDREMRRRQIPRVLLSDGTEPERELPRPAAPDGALTGTPASSGTVTGPARVILDPVGAHLEPGEILIAPSTDPGWTPLFLTAGGLVMEMGGANSHGAVVAREYGIPAVVGVPDATTHLHTGQQVTVDGATGLITSVS